MPTSVRYGPPRSAAALLGLAALVVALLAAPADAPGRALAAVAITGLLAGAIWLLCGPVLRADGRSVRVRGLVRTQELRWEQVTAVVVEPRRRSRALELDTSEGLVAVPAMLLGRTSPGEAAAALRRLRAAALAS